MQKLNEEQIEYILNEARFAPSSVQEELKRIFNVQSKPAELKVGQIIQINPDFKTKCFAGCLAVVTEPKSFGCQCYIQGVGDTFEESKGQYYLRPTWDDFEVTDGIAPWIIGDGDAETN